MIQDEKSFQLFDGNVLFAPCLFSILSVIHIDNTLRTVSSRDAVVAIIQ